MKPKYYPHLTIVAAAAITVAPLCLVISLPWLQSDANIHTTDSAINSQQHVPPSLSLARGLPTRVLLSETVAEESAAQRPTPAGAPDFADTRVAMLVRDDDPEPLIIRDRNDRRLPQAKAEYERTADEFSAEGFAESEVSTEDGVPVPAPETGKIIVAIKNVLTTLSSEADPDLSHEASTSTEVKTLMSDTSEQTTSTERAERPEELTVPQADAPSHFEATGHLAMARQPSGTSKAAVVTTPARKSRTTTKSGRSEADRRRSSRDTGDEMTDPRLAEDGWATGDGFRATAALPLEDVILHQPVESRRVDRVENLVALTRTKGWPIALVKSDLPDDHWWVQQMVGIRGNSFAARVNFGNEQSISGSVYHLVFVFLDSPDEVRRFRIAKQFKELPKGIRHSREYTFVRR